MVDSVKGVNILNTVKWQDDIKSRKRMFQNIRRYKKAVSSIDTLKLKMSGITETKNKIKDLKKEVQAVQNTSMVGPRKPPMQMDVKRQAEEQKRLDDWLSNSNKQSIKEEENLRKQNAAKRKARIQSIRSLKKEEQAQAVKDMRMENKEAARLSKIYAFELSPLVQDLNEERRDTILLELRQIKNAHKLKDVMNEYNSTLRRESALHKENLRLQNKQNFAQERAVGSLKQMAGAAFSIYTAMQGISAIARTGMGMQKINAAMISVSGSTAEAKENISFIRKETLRLGGDLVENTRAFSQLLANRGEISRRDTKELFTGLTELATARGLTADETAGGVKALGQMMGKTRVMAKTLAL